MREEVASSDEKNPRSGSFGVPINMARSRALLKFSHDVSGNSAQLWQAARLKSWSFVTSEQTGSAEHHAAL